MDAPYSDWQGDEQDLRASLNTLHTHLCMSVVEALPRFLKEAGGGRLGGAAAAADTLLAAAARGAAALARVSRVTVDLPAVSSTMSDVRVMLLALSDGIIERTVQMLEGQSGGSRAALELLLKVPAKRRSLRHWLTLGRLYRAARVPGGAQAAYEAALMLEPMAVEAAVALLECGHTGDQVRQLLRSLPAEAAPWYPLFINAHEARVTFDYVTAVRHFGELAEQAPSSLHVLRHLAVSQVQDGQPYHALRTFARIRRIDPFSVDSMDTYASVIRIRGAVSSLNALAQELLESAPREPESWAAYALYADSMGRKERALAVVERSLLLYPAHVFTHLLHGALLLGSGRPLPALSAFTEAHSMSKDLSAFQGMIQCYISLGDVSKAVAVGREAAATMPKSARALALYGLALTYDDGSRAVARQVLERAVRMRPSCAEAVLSLADLDVLDSNHAAALARLRAYDETETLSGEFICTKIAEVHDLSGKPEEALAAYRVALGMNPSSETARAGIDRMLALIGQRGVDNSGLGSDDDYMPHDEGVMTPRSEGGGDGAGWDDDEW